MGVGMGRQIGNQVFPDSDRAHTGTTSSMRNSEGFVQVEMADISSEVAWGGIADLSVHVGPVHVNLSSVFVYDFYHLRDGVFVFAVGGRESDHKGSQFMLVFFCFSSEVLHVHTAVDGIDHYNFHSGQSCAGRVGAVGRFGDQADPSMRLVSAF